MSKLIITAPSALSKAVVQHNSMVYSLNAE